MEVTISTATIALALALALALLTWYVLQMRPPRCCGGHYQYCHNSPSPRPHTNETTKVLWRSLSVLTALALALALSPGPTYVVCPTNETTKVLWRSLSVLLPQCSDQIPAKKVRLALLIVYCICCTVGAYPHATIPY